MVVLCLQWNLDGYFKRLHELQNLIAELHPLIICLQETHLHPIHKVSLKNYTFFRHDYINAKKACGGIAILVHESITSQIIATKSSLQAISVSVKLPALSKKPFSITSIYLPPHINVPTHSLQTLITQLPPPLLVCGDFNAHSPTWGFKRLNNRGDAVENLLLDNPNLTLINTHRSPTHFCVANGSFSTIDLTLCSTSLSPSLSWKTHTDLCDSNHYPIIICHDKIQQLNRQCTPKWILNKADWPLFTNLTANTDTLPTPSTIDQDITHFTELIT